MIIHQIPRDFTKNIKERLFYNVSENFASIDEIFSLPSTVYEKQKSAKSMSADRECKIFTPPQIRPLKTTFLTFPNHEICISYSVLSKEVARGVAVCAWGFI
jgi:hypothetical protein